MTSRSCIYFSRFEAGWPSVSLLVVDSMHWAGWAVSENLTGERAYDFLFGRAISVLFCSSWSRDRVKPSIFCQSQRVFCSSIYIESALNSSEECDEFADSLFKRLSSCLRETFVRTSVFFAAWFTLGQPSTPVRNARFKKTFLVTRKTFDFILGGFQLTSRETYSHRSRYHLESKGFLQRVVLFWLHAENQRKCKKGAKSIISSPEQLGWPKKGTGSGNENAKANFPHTQWWDTLW